ncbi:sensor histidine kinase [Nocardia vaccinii]|uniref:sensor histidine kinase n=1 Tax=Nocardia vaccinii TaxID=1822 RepID=UPI00082D9D98|nr:nitrate- and nitrite sensing domain-containing protein [Nocardia vaccinii]
MAVLPWLSGIRGRILAIALVPNVFLLISTFSTIGHLVLQARHTSNYARVQESTVTPVRNLVLAVDQERLLSIQQLTDGTLAPGALAYARGRFDTALAGMATVEAAYRRTHSRHLDDAARTFDTLQAGLSFLRNTIDTHQATVPDTYAFYSRLLDGMDQGSQMVREYSPDPASTLSLTRTLSLLRMVESMSRARALTVAAGSVTGLAPTLVPTYRNLVGYYHVQATQLAKELDQPYARRLEAIIDSPQWQQTTATEHAVLSWPSTTATPTDTTALPLPAIPIDPYQDASGQIDDELVALWGDQDQQAQQHTAAVSARSERDALIEGAAMTMVAILAWVLSMLLANRVIVRLERLRAATAALAGQQLPAILAELASGARIDSDITSAALYFGHDEIGAVADAFNRAHTAAVTAALTEARTREGVRAVFANIAHRSQMLVHQQLEILDEAERRQSDPAVIDVLYRLDHLATRERRNVENLAVLAGGGTGRQWRRPIPLIELIRSAISETLHYHRVDTGRIPHVLMDGAVVADLAHLLAELMDNATAFSPPHTTVRVEGNLNTAGILVHVSDQGMSMSAHELDRANTLLTEQPDFAVAALSHDSRLGLFVIAQLCARHGISVRFTESDYGGIRASVLVPNRFIAHDHPHTDESLQRVKTYIPDEPANTGERHLTQHPRGSPTAPW